MGGSVTSTLPPHLNVQQPEIMYNAHEIKTYFVYNTNTNTNLFIIVPCVMHTISRQYWVKENNSN